MRKRERGKYVYYNRLLYVLTCILFVVFLLHITLRIYCAYFYSIIPYSTHCLHNVT